MNRDLVSVPVASIHQIPLASVGVALDPDQLPFPDLTRRYLCSASDHLRLDGDSVSASTKNPTPPANPKRQINSTCQSRSRKSSAFTAFLSSDKID